MDPLATPASEAPVTPEVPVTPIEPITPEVLSEEDNEWSDAAKETFPEKKENKEGKTEEPVTDPNKPADPVVPAEAAEKVPEAPAQEARMSQREFTDELEAVKGDVREALTKESPLELKDADGDPIKDASDVMKLVDPRTGQAFTQEAAEIFLIAARQELSEKRNQIEDQVNKIALANVRVKDDTTAILNKFKDVLEAKPELKANLWAQYSKTLVMRGNMIEAVPVSMLDFYSTALAPYAEASEAQAKAEASAVEAQKKAEEIEKRQKHGDRSDVFGAGKIDALSETDKEWSDAHKEIFGN